MSNTVDTHVAQMRFDNAQFERGVATSIASTEKLKKSLDFDNAGKSFNSIEKAASKVTLSGLTEAAETVSLKFSALEIAATTAIANIVNSAVNAGKDIVKGFALEPITQGFGEYELKMGSVQTIMASTGASLETVNGYLAELNTYADKTIYSFSDMTSNIGKFTNAGVDLDKAVAAIQGVSNVAAVSGANTQEASRAMYNFAQALSSGSVRLIDWKSIENANMATVEFKEELLKTAVELGTVVKVGDEYKSVTVDLNGKVSELFTSTSMFNESLSHQWMTTDVLVQTLGRYADETTDIGKKAFAAAQDVKTFSQLIDTTKEAIGSGWATTFELIIGDFNEAKGLFTGISEALGNIINASADARNSLLAGALGSGNTGWDELKSKIEGTGVSFSQFQNEVLAAARSNGKNTDEILKIAGSFEEAVRQGLLSADDLKGAFKRIAESTPEAADSTRQVTTSLEELEAVAQRVILGDFGNGADRVKRLAEAGYEYADVQGLVNKILRGEKIELDSLTDAQLENMGYTKEQIAAFRELADEAENGSTDIDSLIESMSRPTGRELLIDTFRNALSGLMGVMEQVKAAWESVFPPLTAETLYRIIDRLHEFSKCLVLGNEKSYKLRATFQGLFSLADLVTRTVYNMAKTLWDFVSRFLPTANDILTVTANIGNFFTELSRAAEQGNALEYLQLVFGDTIGIIEQFADKLMSIPVIGNIIANLSSKVRETFSIIKADIAAVYNAAGQLIDKFRETGRLDLDDLKGFFSEISEEAEGCFSVVGTGTQTVLTGISSLADGIRNYFDKMVETFRTVKGNIFGFFSYLREEITLSSIVTGLLGAQLVTLGFGIYKAFKAFTGVADKLASPMKAFSDGIKLVSKAVALTQKAKAFEIFTDGLVNLAKGVLILAAALALVANIDRDRLKDAMISLSILSGIMLAMSAATSLLASKLKVSKETVRAAGSILNLAGGLIILASAIKLMENIDTGAAAKGVIIITLLLSELAGACILLAKFAPQLSKGSAFVLALSGAVGILTLALKGLTTLEPADISGSIGIIIGAVAALTALSLACKGVTAGAGFSVLAMVTAFGLLIGIFTVISKLDTVRMEKPLKALLAMLSVFSLVLLASRLAGKNAAKAGAGILAMAGAAILISVAIKMMSKIGHSELDSAMDVMSKLLLLFAAITAASHFAGKEAVKAGVMLVLMSGAVAVLTGIIAVLSILDPKKLDKPLAAVSLLMTLMGAIVGVSKLAKDSKGALIALTVAVSLLGGVLIALTVIGGDRALYAAGAMSAVMAAFAVIEWAAEKTEKLDPKKFAGVMASMTAAVTALGVLLGIFAVTLVKNSVDTAALASSAASLSLLFLVFSKCITMLSEASADIANMDMKALNGTIWSVTGVTAGIAAVLGLFAAATQNVEGMIAKAAALSLFLIAFTKAVSILAESADKLANIDMKALNGTMWSLVGVTAGLALVLGLFAGLTQNIDGMLERTAALSLFLVAFAGSMALISVAGVPAGLAAPAVGLMGLVALELAAVLAMFALATKGIDDLIEKSGALSIFLVSFSGAMVLLAIAGKLASAAVSGLVVVAAIVAIVASVGSLMGSLMSEEQMESLVRGMDLLITVMEKAGEALGAIIGGSLAGLLAGIPSMVEYLNALKDVDPEIMEGAKTLSEALLMFSGAALLNVITAGLGIAGGIINAEELGQLGKGLKAFSDAVSEGGGINVEAVETATKAGKLLAEMQEAFPNTGGLLADLVGDNSWETISTGLAFFGTALMSFGEIVSGHGTGVDGRAYSSDITSCAAAIEKAVEVSHSLAELQTAFPNGGGALAALVGDNTWVDIATGLPQFGTALMAFGEAVSGLKKGNDGSGVFQHIDTYSGGIKKAVELSYSLAELQEALPNIGGLKSWFTGEGTWESFKDGLVEYGEALTAFGAQCQQMVSFASYIGTAIGFMEKLADILKISHEIETSGYTTAWDTIQIGLEEFGSTLTGFGQHVKGAAENNSAVTTALEQTADITEAMRNMEDVDTEAVNTVLYGIFSMGQRLKHFYENIKEVNDRKLSNVVASITDLLEFVGETAGLDTSGLEDFKMALETVAHLGIDRFIDAFDDARYDIQNAAGGMVDSFSIAVTNKSEEIKSLGKEMAESLARGLDEGELEVKIASERLANAILKSMKETLGIYEGYSGKGAASVSGYIARAGNNDEVAGTFGLFDGAVEGVTAVGEACTNTGNAITGVVEGVTGFVDTVRSSISGKLTGDLTDFTDGVLDSLDKKGYGDIKKWFTDMFGDPEEKIQKLQDSIATTEHQLEQAKANNKDGKNDYRIQELTKKLSDLKSELAVIQALSGQIDLSSIFTNLDLYGISSLQDVLTDDFLSLLSPEEAEKLNKALSGTFEDTATAGKKAYKELFEAYKDGKIDQAEYDRQYLALLSENADSQVDIQNEAADKMAEYTEDKLEKLRDDYEDEIKDIQKDMDKYEKDNTTSYTKALTFTTNKDVYDKTVKDYETKLEDLNEQLEDAEKKYGKNSDVAKLYRKEIEKTKKALEDYKKEYKKSGKKDDEIISVKFTDKVKSNKNDLLELLEQVRKLKSRGIVGKELLLEIAQMDKKEALAAVEYLNSLSDSELKAVESNKQKETEAARELESEFWEYSVQEAGEKYAAGINGVIAELPDTAKAIGYDTALKYAEGFEQGTKDTLSSLGITASGFITGMIADPALSGASGMIKKMTGKDVDFTGMITGGGKSGLADFSGVVGRLGKGIGLGKNLGDGLISAAVKYLNKNDGKQPGSVLSENISIRPVIRPSLDMTDATVSMEEWQKKHGTFDLSVSRESAQSAGSSVGSGKQGMTEIQNGSLRSSGGNRTINQYFSITSPDPVSTATQRKIMRRGMQMATVANMR